MSKHDLRARPVFYRTRNAIEVHLTEVMAALAVARYLQDAAEISIARIMRELCACRRSLSTSMAARSPPSTSSAKPQPASSNHYNPQSTIAS